MPSPFTSSSSASSSPSSIFSLVMNQSIEKLHLDLPLISTRRTSSADKLNVEDNVAYAADTSRSVPFLWERAPGVPKDHLVKNEEEVFTPKPPPGRWRPPNLNNSNNKSSSGGCSDDSGGDSNGPDYDTCDENDANVNVFHDAIGPKVTRTASFIMNRFLPAANALAASSIQTFPKYSSTRKKAHPGSKDPAKLPMRKIQTGHCVDPHNSASPSKACGIMLLFPFSVNRSICGLKSPIRCQTPKTSRLEDFTQRSKKVSDDYGLSADEDDGVSSKAWKSPGWGLPLLDARSGSSRVARRKEKGAAERHSTRSRPLPKLKSPSDPWLANALNSVNRRKY